MRITEIDLEIEDLEWYGLDKDRRIALFTSGGSKMVPEFICESRENLEVVCEYFEQININISEKVKFSSEIIDCAKKTFLEECRYVSMKGLYYYDIDDEGKYVCLCKPEIELKYDDLPLKIQNIMKNWRFDRTKFGFTEKILIFGADS